MNQNSSLTAANATNLADLSPSRASEPLAVFTVLVLLGIVCIVVALALRCCPLPTVEGEGAETDSAAASRREREQKRLEYVHKVLKTRSWHVAKSPTEFDKPPRSGASVVGAALTAPNGDNDDASDKVSHRSSPQHLCLEGPTELESGQSKSDESHDYSESPPDTSTKSPLQPELTSTCCVDDDYDGNEEEEDDDDEGPLCAICLCPFEESERVCESNNTSCKHVFHQECLEPWLLRHEHCPVCRESYLRKPGKATKKAKHRSA